MVCVNLRKENSDYKFRNLTNSKDFGKSLECSFY